MLKFYLSSTDVETTQKFRRIADIKDELTQLLDINV